MTTKLEGLETKLGGLETELKGLKTELEGLKKERTNCPPDRINALSGEIAALRTQIGGLETKIAAVINAQGTDGSESLHLPLVVLFSLNIYSSLIGVSNLISSSYYFPDSLSVLVPHLLQGQNELDAVLLSFLSFASQPFICVRKNFFELGIMSTQSSWEGSSLQISPTSSIVSGNNGKKLL